MCAAWTRYIEELKERCKHVVSMLNTIHTDVCRDLDARLDTKEFRHRLALENDLSKHQPSYKHATCLDFIASI